MAFYRVSNGGTVELTNPTSIQQNILYYYYKPTTIDLSDYSYAVIAIGLTNTSCALFAVDLKSNTYIIRSSNASTGFIPTVSINNHIVTLTPPSSANTDRTMVIFAYT